MAAAATSMNPHVLFVTFAGPGHLNPFLRFAKRVAAKGVDITMYTTVENESRIGEFSKTPAASGEFQTVGLGRLRFEFFSDGCGDKGVPKEDLQVYMAKLQGIVTRNLAALIRRSGELGQSIACVVSNPFLPWAVDVSTGMGIPCAVLWVQSCAVFSVYYHYRHALVDFPDATKPDTVVMLPGVPSLRTHELPSLLLDSTLSPFTDAILSQIANLSKASWVFINTFEELERDAIAGISPLTPVIPVGPLVELPPSVERDDRLLTDLSEANDCIRWLDSQEPQSVIYVSVGSVVVLSQEEMTEMAEGLRRSSHPFLWVVRDQNRGMLPEGFEEGTKGRGLVVGWSPQDRVLHHPSTGCFLTHCGWNSTLECLASGVPVITFPHWGDQVTDAKFLVETFGVGVHLRPKPPNAVATQETMGHPSFTREDLQRRIEEVMVGPRAEGMRDSAARWREAAALATADGGTSDLNIRKFTEEMSTRGQAAAGRSED